MLSTRTSGKKWAKRKSHLFLAVRLTGSDKKRWPSSNDCLPKNLNYFFLTESTLCLTLSLAAVAAESMVVLAESATEVMLSLATVAAESTLVSVLEEPLQAAKAPIANTTKSFFIVMCLCVNDFMLIPELGKSNLRGFIFYENFNPFRKYLIINELHKQMGLRPDKSFYKCP
jgi:hypothetical protein